MNLFRIENLVNLLLNEIYFEWFMQTIEMA